MLFFCRIMSDNLFNEEMSFSLNPYFLLCNTLACYSLFFILENARNIFPLKLIWEKKKLITKKTNSVHGPEIIDMFSFFYWSKFKIHLKWNSDSNSWFAFFATFFYHFFLSNGRLRFSSLKSKVEIYLFFLLAKKWWTDKSDWDFSLM